MSNSKEQQVNLTNKDELQSYMANIVMSMSNEECEKLLKAAIEAGLIKA